MKSIFFGILLIATHAQAGTAGSGGGNGLICHNGTKTVLYDFFEAEQLRQIKFDNSLLGADEYKTALNVLKRMKQFDPVRAKKYRQHVQNFKNEAVFLADVNLPVIDDTGSVVIPTGCSLRQIVVQKSPQFPEDKLYHVDLTAWQTMSIGDRAGLILHEVVYREAMALGHLDSIKTRYFTSMISSMTFVASGIQGYHRLVDLASLRQYFVVRDGSNKYVFVGRANDKIDHRKDHFEIVSYFCTTHSLKASLLKYNQPTVTNLINEFTLRFGSDFRMSVMGIGHEFMCDKVFCSDTFLDNGHPFDFAICE